MKKRKKPYNPGEEFLKINGAAAAIKQGYYKTVEEACEVYGVPAEKEAEVIWRLKNIYGYNIINN